MKFVNNKRKSLVDQMVFKGINNHEEQNDLLNFVVNNQSRIDHSFNQSSMSGPSGAYTSFTNQRISAGIDGISHSINLNQMP